jgi:hypothetical protein
LRKSASIARPALGKATLFVDTDGNAATAEMTIALVGGTSLTGGDFIL